MKSGWIGVDLDGTLAVDVAFENYDPKVIGPPIPAMVERIKSWLKNGIEVRIFTARVSGQRDGIEIFDSVTMIQDWCEKYIGQKLPITCIKDFKMWQLWDDRAIQVVRNTGERVGNVDR